MPSSGGRAGGRNGSTRGTTDSGVESGLLGLALDTIALAIVACGVTASALFCCAACVGAAAFARMRRGVPPPAGPLPPVTVLKPLRGCDPHLAANLASLCRQDHPDFQVVCGVHDPADPAVPVVRQLQREFPGRVDLVIDGRLQGANRKVSNLCNMLGAARHDLLVIADSDIRVPGDYLRRLAARLRDPRVGIVSCLYRARGTGSRAARLEAMTIDMDFMPLVLVARLVETPRYAFGATMALRRAVLEASGGFRPLADMLADDFHLGRRVAACGYRLELSEVVVETVFTVDSWRHLFRHQLRWARTYRTCRPAGYFLTVFTHGTLWALLAVAYAGGSAAGWQVAAALCALRLGSALYVANHGLGAAWRVSDLALLPLRDLGGSLLWLLAFLGSTVRWNGMRFRVRRDGQLEPAPGQEPRAGVTRLLARAGRRLSSRGRRAGG